MERPDFKDLSYLSKGSSHQQKLYRLLVKERVMEKLSQFSPILIGTVPLDIAIESSDVDIACYVKDLTVFADVLEHAFGGHKDYTFRRKIIPKKTVGIANFKIAGIPIEIYGENRPVVDQYGYRHMLVEFHLLERYGISFKSRICKLKSLGWKTESAFAKLLGLKGDPYQELLTFNFNDYDQK